MQLEDAVSALGDPPSAPDDAGFLTDFGNAERFAVDHCDDVRYVTPDHGWHVWDGRRWRPDDDGDTVRRMKVTAREFNRRAVDVDDEKLRKQLVTHALRWEHVARVNAALELARTDQRLIAALDTLDADPMLLNVGNGTVHLKVGELNEHRRRHMITKLAGVDHDRAAGAPRWSRFLEEVFAGDGDVIAFVQRAVGYSLTGLTREQVLFLLWGRGANGKSTFVETLRALFGDYGQQAPAETFMATRSDRVRNELARLPGARFVAAVETGEGRFLDETLVKSLTGGDTIAARHLYREHFEFRPMFKAWIATNHKPEIRGTDEAIWRRVLLIPFTVTFSEDERDATLPEQLRAELPGILNWAIAGCTDWLYDGLNPPDAVRAATSAYRAEMDVLGTFLDERCEANSSAAVKARQLYRAYVDWATAAGEHAPLTEKAFSLALSERGYEKQRHNDGQYWQRLQIRPERSVQGAGS